MEEHNNKVYCNRKQMKLEFEKNFLAMDIVDVYE